MKNAVNFKGLWLMPNSTAFALFHLWKKETDPKLQKTARAKFESHLKEVKVKYSILCD